MRDGSWLRTVLHSFAVTAAVLAAGGCGAPETDAGVLATFAGGRVTAAELEDAILSLPATARPGDPEARDEFYRDLLRQLALRRHWLEQARRVGVLEDPETADPWREMRRQILLSALLEREVEVPAATPDQVLAHFERNREAYVRPERREVFHLFLRPEQGESRPLLRARMSALRERHLAGEPFPLLARQHSQSQLRSGDGALGWIEPGQLRPRLDEIVFGLEEAVPSEVMMTPSGAHLFFAARVVAAESPSLEDVRPQVRRMLQAEIQAEAIARYLESRPPAPTDWVPQADELRALLAGGDPNAIVAKVGDWTLSAGELLERLEGPRPQGMPGSRAEDLLATLVQRERLAAQAIATGLDEDPAVARAFETARDQLAFAAMQRRELLAAIDREPARLEAFFARERGRFAGPLRLRVERLAVALNRDSGSVMATLAAAGDGLASGDLSLRALAEEVGATVEEPVWKTLAELRAEGGPSRVRLAAVAVDGFSEPVSNGREIELFHVLDRSVPESPEFGQIRDEVKEAYLQVHGAPLYEQLVSERLEALGFEILEDRLASYAEKATGLVGNEGA